MSFPVAHTLGEVRREVAIACNLGSQPTRTRQAQPIIDNRIREAHAELAPRADWLASYKKVTIPLIEDQATYDFPDDCWPSDIAVMRIIDADGNRIDLDAGVHTNEINSAKTSAQPVLYHIIDRAFTLYPAPDATWVLLEIEYSAAAPELIEDADVITVDYAILVRLATRKCRAYFKLPPLETAAEYDVAQNDAIMAQSDGETFHLGGHKSHWDQHRQANRVDRAGFPLSGDGWNPPGF